MKNKLRTDYKRDEDEIILNENLFLAKLFGDERIKDFTIRDPTPGNQFQENILRFLCESYVSASYTYLLGISMLEFFM